MEYKEFESLLIDVEKPTRYIGEEINMVRKETENIELRYAFCFPDLYEIGMSHLGLRIMYNIINNLDYAYCERAFMPWIDFIKLLEENNMELYSLETKTPLKEFDVLGFTLQYEMSYSNILKMLELSDIEVLSKKRGENDPLICAGGPCAYNPEVLEPFIDFFVIGDGEEVIVEILDMLRKLKKNNLTRKEKLNKLFEIEGVYVPTKVKIEYNEDGTIKNIIGKRTKKRLVKDLDQIPYPKNPIVPYMKIVHDRAVLELFRGCKRGCRFCQAGFIYRPVREKSIENLTQTAKKLIENTGYEELSLSSLSTSDYSNLKELTDRLLELSNEKMINLALPSLRVDAFSVDLMNKVSNNKKTGLTFAPEAGSQRLRNIINKGIVEEDLLKSVKIAFEGGYRTIKLYFMLGLPKETYEDIEGIAKLADKIIDIYIESTGSKKAKGLKMNISTAFFVPKAFTPFEWEGQDKMDEYYNKVKFLKNKLTHKSIKYNWHDPKTSYLEALFARGDRRVAKVIYKAFKKGIFLDGWREFFDFDKWMEAIKETNIDPDFYINRKREDDEIFPWEVIDARINKQFLLDERNKAYEGIQTPDCISKCSNCGILEYKAGVCIK